MIKNYFKIAWRNLIKNKGTSFINIGGLAVGMAVATLIGLWIWDELSFDKHNKNYDTVAQLARKQTTNGEIFISGRAEEKQFSLTIRDTGVGIAKENIDFIFQQVAQSLDTGGCFYLCELHPFKQLQASRARFEHEGELIQLEYFIHHISDYFDAARNNQLDCILLKEWFDNNDRTITPRLVSFLFQKKEGN